MEDPEIEARIERIEAAKKLAARMAARAAGKPVPDEGPTPVTISTPTPAANPTLQTPLQLMKKPDLVTKIMELQSSLPQSKDSKPLGKWALGRLPVDELKSMLGNLMNSGIDVVRGEEGVKVEIRQTTSPEGKVTNTVATLPPTRLGLPARDGVVEQLAQFNLMFAGFIEAVSKTEIVKKQLKTDLDGFHADLEAQKVQLKDVLGRICDEHGVASFARYLSATNEWFLMMSASMGARAIANIKKMEVSSPTKASLLEDSTPMS